MKLGRTYSFNACVIGIKVLFDKIIKMAPPSKRAENPQRGH